MDEGVNSACGSNIGCHSSSTFTKSFDHFNQNGVLTVTVTGTYADTNTRDHMKGILHTTMGMATTNVRLDFKGSSEDNDSVEDVPSFAQVVIRDPTGAIQAQMTIKLPSAVHQHLQKTAMSFWNSNWRTPRGSPR